MVFVIIPNYNGLKFLPECLKSLYEQNFKNFEVILVDNASTDRSLEFVRNNFSKIKVKRFAKNFGFAKAVNWGIRQALTQSKSEDAKDALIALLNNDTRVDRNWLSSLVAAANRYPKVNIFASNILSWDGKKIDSQGIDFSWKGKAWQIRQGQSCSPIVIHQSLPAVFGACAAAALYRREIFDKIGLFDEDFGSYLEDVDFSLRAGLAGEKCLFVPDAVVYHYGGATSKKMGNFKAKQDCKNWLFLIAKNYPFKFIFCHFWPIFVERLRNVSGLLKATPPFFWLPVMIKVYGQVLLKLPMMVKKRSNLAKLMDPERSYAFLESKT